MFGDAKSHLYLDICPNHCIYFFGRTFCAHRLSAFTYGQCRCADSALCVFMSGDLRCSLQSTPGLDSRKCMTQQSSGSGGRCLDSTPKTVTDWSMSGTCTASAQT